MYNPIHGCRNREKECKQVQIASKRACVDRYPAIFVGEGWESKGGVESGHIASMVAAGAEREVCSAQPFERAAAPVTMLLYGIAKQEL
jgi:hypothetical protein